MAGGNETAVLLNQSIVIEDTVNYLPIHRKRGFSDDFTHYMSTVNIAGICAFVSLFGIASNMINFIIFKRQGFQDTVNITLFATSVSDLISMITTLWVAICYNPLLGSVDIPFLPMEVQLLTGDIPHLIAMNATSWLTAFVTFERCLCILFPLKVRDILPIKRAKAIIILIVVSVLASQIPTYYSIRLEWKFHIERNRTMYGLAFTENFKIINTITFYAVNVFGPFLSFNIVAICSVLLVIKLKQKGKWRQQSIGIDKDGRMEIRDRKVVKMVLAVAVIYIATYTPSVIILCFTAYNLELSPTGHLANNYFVAVSCAVVFETTNATVNILIYYNMSSKYKNLFRSMFLGSRIEA